MPDLASIALALPAVDSGLACAGTSLESRTFATAGKVFLFVGAREARLKLAASAGEAKDLGFPAGGTGWVKLPLDALPATAVLRRWIAESHALMARPGASRGTAATKTGKAGVGESGAGKSGAGKPAAARPLAKPRRTARR